MWLLIKHVYCSSSLTGLWEYVSCQCLSRGQNLSWRPINSHWCLSDFVPASSDRRSYYFLITLVARVPGERFSHVTDSFVNTTGISLSTSLGVVVTFLAFYNAPQVFSFSSLTWFMLNHTLPSPDTWGARVTCAEVRLFLTLPPADQEQPPSLYTFKMESCYTDSSISSLVDALCPCSFNTISAQQRLVGGRPGLRGHECQLVQLRCNWDRWLCQGCFPRGIQV